MRVVTGTTYRNNWAPALLMTNVKQKKIVQIETRRQV